MIIPGMREYFFFLEGLRRSGIVNMYGAAPYLADEFGLGTDEARKILALWMKSYDREDYKIGGYHDADLH